MNRIMVIGCPGSGKSTFSKALHKTTGIPLFHLDMMYWNADRTTVDKAVFRERLLNTIQKNEWIIDGNYGSTIELRLQACDTVVFLDYSLDVCLNGIKERINTSYRIQNITNTFVYTWLTLCLYHDYGYFINSSYTNIDELGDIVLDHSIFDYNYSQSRYSYGLYEEY